MNCIVHYFGSFNLFNTVKNLKSNLKLWHTSLSLSIPPPGPVNILLDGLKPWDDPTGLARLAFIPSDPSFFTGLDPAAGPGLVRGGPEGRPGTEASPEALPEQPGPPGGRKSRGRVPGRTPTGHQTELGLPDEGQALSLAGLLAAPRPTPPSDRQMDRRAGGILNLGRGNHRTKPRPVRPAASRRLDCECARVSVRVCEAGGGGRGGRRLQRDTPLSAGRCAGYRRVASARPTRFSSRSKTV